MQLYSFDEDYVRRLRTGDRWTEEHFLAYFQQLLLLKLRGRVKSMQVIEDIRQEVFVRVFRALRSEDGGLRDGRKLGAFVNSICNNVLLETYRSGGRTDPLEREHEEVADSADVEQELLTFETKERVLRVLSTLDPRDAALLRAVFLEERDKDEVCRELGVDRNYLRVLVHRAKEKFRAEFVGGTVHPIAARVTVPRKASPSE